MPQIESRLAIRLPHASTVSICCIVPYGGIHDPYRLPGLAHFTEHMVARNAPRTPNAPADYESALRFGGFLDAYMSLSLTGFEIEVPPEHHAATREWLIRLICDFSCNEEDWKREQRVLWLQIRDHKYVYDTNVILRRLLYGTRSRYSRRIGGTVPSLRRTTCADIYRFWRRHYKPERMFLLEVGALPDGIEPSALLAITEQEKLRHFLTRNLHCTFSRNEPLVRFEPYRTSVLDVDLVFLIPADIVRSPERLLCTQLLSRLLQIKLIQRLRHEHGDISEVYGGLSAYPLRIHRDFEAIGKYPVRVVERALLAASECRAPSVEDLIAAAHLRFRYLHTLLGSAAEFANHLLQPTGLFYAEELQLQREILSAPERSVALVHEVAQRVLTRANLVLMLRGRFTSEERASIQELASRFP